MNRKRKTRKTAPLVRPIHANIKRIRKARKMSQRELGEILGLDKTSISHWENNLSAPNWRRLPDVAAALGVTEDELTREAA